MAFERVQAVNPSALGELRVTLIDAPGQGDPGNPQATGYMPPRKEACYCIEVQMNDGSTKTLQGDLVPHLSGAQITGLMDFMAAMRAKAEAEIL